MNFDFFISIDFNLQPRYILISILDAIQFPVSINFDPFSH